MGIEKFKNGQFSGPDIEDSLKNIGNENLIRKEDRDRLNDLLRAAVSSQFGAGQPQPKDEDFFKQIYGVPLGWAINIAEKDKAGKLGVIEKEAVMKTMRTTKKENR